MDRSLIIAIKQMSSHVLYTPQPRNGWPMPVFCIQGMQQTDERCIQGPEQMPDIDGRADRWCHIYAVNLRIKKPDDRADITGKMES
jgi:hypothetical protein